MDTLGILSWLCIVTSFGFVVSGIPVFIPIIKSGSTGNTPFLPFLLGFVNTVACLWYGVLKEDFTMTVVNSVGLVHYIFYVSTYLYYAKEKDNTTRLAVLGGAFLLGLYVYFNHVLEERTVIENQLGLTTCLLVLASNISPLAELGAAIRERSSESFSASMAIALFATSLAWTLYGVLIEDIYVQIPSVPGMVSGIMQLALLWTFPTPTHRKPTKSD